MCIKECKKKGMLCYQRLAKKRFAFFCVNLQATSCTTNKTNGRSETTHCKTNKTNGREPSRRQSNIRRSDLHTISGKTNKTH